MEYPFTPKLLNCPMALPSPAPLPQVHATVQELFERNSSDDFLFVFLVLINQYVREVPLVANSTKSQKAGLEELKVR
jgi:hypothetical protein